jgi:signal transduction histidine kinase
VLQLIFPVSDDELIYMMIKNVFFEYIHKVARIEDVKLDFVINKYVRLRKDVILLQFIVALLAYIIIAYGYFSAGYYQLLMLTLLSMSVPIAFFVFNRKRFLDPRFSGLIFIFLPILNIVAKDLFFLYVGNPNVRMFFLHTHFMLLLFIPCGGLVGRQRNSLYVGGFSVLWIWFFTILLNDSYLWSLVTLDSFLFIGITLLVYFTYSCGRQINVKFGEMALVVNSQNEELNRLIDLKNWMLNMIVHDIKNPLNRIIYASKMDVVKKDDVVEPSKQILSIIEDILDVYKMEEARLSLKTTVQDLNYIIGEAFSQVKYLLLEKNITLVKRTSLKCTLDVDVELLVRVFVNLLSNSIKYSKPNSTIEIRVFQNEKMVRVEVMDHGEGVSLDNVEHIFEKYYQVNPTHLGNVRSTGIGLTFCKMTIENHGGVIGASSKVNEGTLIWFELPTVTFEVLDSEEMLNLTTVSCEYTPEDEKLMLQYKLKLINLAVYETSEILNVIEECSTCSSAGLLYWKDEVLKSSMTGNAEYFNKLKEIKKETLDT